MAPPTAREIDREILRLGLPALGALAAEPLYLLVDTAIVGHLGTTQLAALAIAATVLGAAFTCFNFLTYGTTAQVARAFGAGERVMGGRLAAQALWLSVAIGLVLMVALLALAVPAVAIMGGKGGVADGAVLYLRLSALGVPWAIVALAGQGYLRGAHDLRTPLIIVVCAHATNVVLELLFVYGFDWGLAGSAWGTVIAQTGMGLAFARVLWRSPADTRRFSRALMRPLVRVGGDIFVRTTALYASFTVASAVLARVSAAALGAHQICFQIFVFLALVLDAVAIAAQVMVGRMLGAGDADGAVAAGRRMIGWSLAVGAVFGVVLLALTNVVPEAFTDDRAVLDQAHKVWPLFALMQPFAGIVFALDGILIGASDTRFLKWSMVFAALGVYIPVAIASLEFGWGIVGVWCGLIGLMAARLITCGGRFLGRRWALTGAPSAA